MFQQGLHLSDGLLGMASVAQLQNDPSRARGYAEQAIKVDPASLNALLFAGELALNDGDTNAALAWFDQASELPNGAYTAGLGIVRSHLINADLQQANAELESMLPRYKDAPPVQYLRGLVSFRLDDLETAENALRVVQQFDNEHAPTLYLMGVIKYRQGRLNQANDSLRRYLALDNQNTDVRKLLATIANAQGDSEEVVTLLEPLSGATNDPQLWAMLGSAYLKMSKATLATDAFQKAVQLAPDEAPFRNQLAVSLLAAGEDQKARATLDSAIELDADQFQTDYIRVMLAVRDNDFGAASEAVEALIAKSQDNPIGYNLKGAIALAQNQVEVAVASFKQALSIDPAYLPAARGLAAIAERMGNNEEAERVFSRLLDQPDANEGARLGLAQLALRRGDVDAALGHLREAVAEHPDSLPPHVGLVRLLLASGDVSAANSAVEQALTQFNESIDLLLLKAETASALGRTHEVRRIADVIRSQSNRYAGNPTLLLAIGNLHMGLGDLTLARASFEQAQAASSAVLPEVIAASARLDIAENQVAGAKAKLAQLEELQVDNVATQLLRADLLIIDEQWQQAQTYLESMVEQGSRPGLSRLVLLLGQLGDTQAAQTRLKAWLQDHPQDRGMEMLLANSYLQAGTTASALQQYEAMLPTDDPVLLNNLAWLYFEKGDDRALEFARRAHQASPNNPDIGDTLGWILVNQGQAAEALQLLRDSARARPDRGVILYHLGVAYQAVGRNEEAQEALRRALQTRNFEEVSDAQSRLEQLAE